MGREDVFGCAMSDCRDFSVQDPFNPQNIVSGLMCLIPDHRYGALCIEAVNGHLCGPQMVYGAPKFHYPFDKNGNFHFPIVSRVDAYEKLDGTNIVSFMYSDGVHDYLSFKTRLSPFLAVSKFGDFKGMWSEILKRNSGIVGMCETDWCYGKLALSFELYGQLNKHLISYDIDLDYALLFGVRQDTLDVVAPWQIKSDFRIPKTRMFRDREDLIEFYGELRSGIDNKHTEDGVEGSEGWMLYCQKTDGKNIVYKCKPHDIEEIHWAAGGIPNNSILATVYNAYESGDTVTYDMVVRLLVEEYSPAVVEKKRNSILRIMDEVRIDMEFRAEVARVYRSLGVDVERDKGGAMRAMSEHFPASKMRRVYSAIKYYGGAK